MAKKILIAEDEVAISKALKLKLEKQGFAVKVVADGQAALNELKSEGYDLMLLDLMMPKVDGFGVLEGIKQSQTKPVVFISSNLSQPTDRKKALDLGADDFLVKSDVSLKEIVEKINRALA